MEQQRKAPRQSSAQESAHRVRPAAKATKGLKKSNADRRGHGLETEPVLTRRARGRPKAIAIAPPIIRQKRLRFKRIAKGGVCTPSIGSKGKTAVVDLRTPSPIASRAPSVQPLDDPYDRGFGYLRFPLSPDTTLRSASHLLTPFSDDDEIHSPRDRSLVPGPCGLVVDDEPVTPPLPAQASLHTLHTPISLSPSTSITSIGPTWTTRSPTPDPSPTKPKGPRHVTRSATISPSPVAGSTAQDGHDDPSHPVRERSEPIGHLFARLLMEEDELAVSEEEDGISTPSPQLPSIHQSATSTGWAMYTENPLSPREDSFPDRASNASDSNIDWDEGEMDEVEVEVFGYRVLAGQRPQAPDIPRPLVQYPTSPFKGLSPRRPRPEQALCLGRS